MAKKNNKKGPIRNRTKKDKERLEAAHQRMAEIPKEGQNPNLEYDSEVQTSEKEIPANSEIAIESSYPNGSAENPSLLKEVEVEVATGEKIEGLEDKIMESEISGGELFESIKRGIENWNTSEKPSSKER